MVVSQLRIASGDWYEALLNHLFLKEDVDEILSIPISMRGKEYVRIQVSYLLNHKVLVDVLCSICSKFPESTLHALLGYPKLKTIRAGFGLLDGRLIPGHYSILDFMIHL
ncbi:hypothetical protein JRO89_XS08G0081700 [Xanthoceras sorbifolium]|uniref:Uncharacterized protein n=1 Tax=Xanthoceras sorbifolium TaxID=99658 RepID=A0ABQ8HP35_9ROSI|nr:hypothetical protein JRO89_XS08G0081700 [Xanthoceras sorbifolium]